MVCPWYVNSSWAQPVLYFPTILSCASHSVVLRERNPMGVDNWNRCSPVALFMTGVFLGLMEGKLTFMMFRWTRGRPLVGLS